jgi:hypothetical protein
VKTKPFLIGFLVVMAAVVAVSAYFSFTIQPSDQSIVAVKSPDGRYKAVRLRLMRPGHPPFCADSIAIFLSVYPNSFVDSDKIYEVYAAPCATITGSVPAPDMQWLSNTKLRITYSPPPAPDRVKVKMKPMDASSYVHIDYVGR